MIDKQYFIDIINAIDFGDDELNNYEKVFDALFADFKDKWVEEREAYAELRGSLDACFGLIGDINKDFFLNITEGSFVKDDE